MRCRLSYPSSSIGQPFIRYIWQRWYFTSIPSIPGNSREIVSSSSTFRKNWTFETITPEAHATTRLMTCSLFLLDLIAHFSNFPLR